jgi:AcrR family transcriptional regulator
MADPRLGESAASPSARPSRRARPENERRLGPNDWVEAAILALQDCSIESIRVDTLADALGVTKGSFYYHFSGRDQLLEAVLQKWKSSMTAEIETFILKSVGTPSARIRRLIRIAMAPRPNVPGGPLEIRLRTWAHRNPHVAAVVHDVDEARLSFLRQMYRQAGQTEKRAHTLAFLHMSYVIGARVFLDGKTEKEYREGVALGEEFLSPE